MADPPPLGAGAAAPASGEAAAVPEGACKNFIFGRCRRGNCRFLHDPAARVETHAAFPPVATRSTASSAAPAGDGREAPVAAPPPPPPPAAEPRSSRSVDFLLRGESVKTNPYLREFAGAPWLPMLLEAPECRSLFNTQSRALRKELSEAFGARTACHRALRKLGVDPGGLAGEPAAGAAAAAAPAATVVDLCCGKGFASLVLALCLPRASVLAADTNPDMDLSHFRLCANLAFQRTDITAADAGASLGLWRRAADGGGDAPLVIVGTHLCGALAMHAIRLFREAPAPVALVLVPCCLNGRLTQLKRCAKKLRIDPYRLWCLSLLFELPTGDGCRRELLVDDDVRSERNAFLIATRTK